MEKPSNFETGFASYQRKHFKKAFKIFLEGAEDGDTDCMSQVAIMLTCGEGAYCDYDKALEWELRAVKSGSTSSMINLGITYRIKGDIPSARSWFEKALEQGDGEAALQLARLYMVSDKEKDKVRKYLREAIQNGRTCEGSIEEAKTLLKDL